MLDKNRVRALLDPFYISMSDESIDKLFVYLNLLLRWNQKINLTSISTPEECVTRHFGESLLGSHVVRLHGSLLDIGSGAGFPGLALKLVSPDLYVVLLEPVGKKRAFLKEVARTCGMSPVRVVGSRLEDFERGEPDRTFDIVTIRAVGGLESLIPTASSLLKSGGQLCLWLGGRQIASLRDASPNIQWQDPVAIPFSEDRFIMAGSLA
jgi:16S rRNA (guanine527-N7)-methyltransferase